jgi:hypothetical protein
MPTHFRTFVAISAIVAVAHSSAARFVGQSDTAQPGSANVYSAAACDARLVARLEPRESQRPTRSGRQDAARRLAVRAPSPGIEYRIPANPKATLFQHTLTGFDAVVEFAAGRGRLDMMANPASPELVAEGVSVAPPLAKPGEYYLFDSTGFILVRPSQKTFSSFLIANHEFNYENRRNGWPSEFAFIADGALKIDTLGARPLDGRVIRHEPTRVYWILTMGQTLPMFPVRAVGRLSIADAPPGEGGIARWIGPTEALADMAHRGAVVDERNVELLSFVPLYPPQRSSIDLSQRQNIECLRKADIDLAKLVLPSDFNEAPWPGFQNETGLPRLTERAVAKWRAVPRGE